MAEIVFPFHVLQAKARHGLLQNWGPYPASRRPPQNLFSSSTISHVHVISSFISSFVSERF
jgi:hypothetical protein